ncbi:MAG: LuxR C-terminal-related transcriptional regulator [Pseudonocardiaceae bacterium]
MREGLVGLLSAEPGIEVVAAVARGDELSAISRDFNVLLSGAEDHLGSRFKFLRFNDTDSASALIDRLRGTPGAECGDPPILPDPSNSRPMLSPREVQVMQGIANGLATAQVAMSLGITRKTVENHKQRIFAKLGVQSQAHAVAVAVDSGLLGTVNLSRRGIAG